MNKTVYLGLSILELNKIEMQLWWRSKVMLRGYKQLFSVHKTEDIFTDIGKDAEARFVSSIY